MERELLETFIVIAKVQNISKAAKLLFVSQATVSYRLKILEKKLNTRLISRSKGSRQTALTVNGKRLLPLAQAWMNVDASIEKFAAYKDVLDLRVGSTDSINNFLLKDFFIFLGNDKRNWKIKIHTTHTSTIYEELLMNNLDLALCLEEKLESHINSQVIYTEPQIIIGADPSLNGKIVSSSELDMKKMIYINSGYSYRKWYQKYVKDGSSPIFKVDSYQLAWNLMGKELWFFAPVCFYLEQVKKGESSSIACLRGKAPIYEVCLATENENESLRHYEITIFKRQLTQYLHRKKHEIDEFLHELLPEKLEW